MVVLIVMIALLGLGMTGLFLTSGSIQMNTNINLRNQALVVAEAGIERARGILNNTTAGWVPPVPDMLKGSTSSADDVPATVNDCQGTKRGAILVDQITLNCNSSPTPAGCTLQDVTYPSLDRTKGLPDSAGAITRTALGTYTVFIRQDQADCRMGNYTCDYVPANGTGGADAGVGAGGAGGTAGNTTCTVPANTPAPNGSVIIRSEGVASDGKTRVVLEVTMTPSLGAAQASNTPMSALCAAGANGCDDNSSVQNGIVVNSSTTQTAPPSSGGTSGNGGAPGTGGAVATGGAVGTGGVFSGAAGNNGGTVGTGGAVGTGGQGTGGHGTGGNTTCPNESCAKIAILGVPGIWDPSSASGGDARFASWLQTHSSGCAQPFVIDFESKEITSSLLSSYNVLILRDMYHTANERNACASAANNVPLWGQPSVDSCLAQYCYRNDGQRGLCSDQTATYTSTATSTSVATISGCPTTKTMTATATRTGNWTGSQTGKITASVWGSDVNGTATYTATQTTTTTGTNTVTVSATTTCQIAGAPTPAAMPAHAGDPLSAPTAGSYGITSYNYGSARKFFTRELDAIEAWVKLGNGIATTSSYYYQAPEVGNVNSILARFNLKYGTTDAAGHIETILAGTNGGGDDFGKVSATINEFVSGAPPFSYVSAVNLLQVRGAVPLYLLSPLTGAGTPTVSAIATYECPIQNGTYGNSTSNCSYTNPSCTVLSTSKNIGYYVDYIGTGNGRVVAWGDEWLTYDQVWNAKNNCQQTNYQPDNYWNNVVRWLGHCSATGSN
jgi:hypothetical protein